MSKRSISYKDLMGGKVSQVELEKLATAGMLTDATYARVGHIGRFLGRVGNAMPNSDLKVGDVFAEADMQKFWQETADDGADVGRCPLMQ
jgi:hypothetical protein